MNITLCWAGPQQQFERSLQLPCGSTIVVALQRLRAELTHLHPEIAAQLDWDAAPTGIFGELRDRCTVLRDGDRVEIYRPLRIDPKEGRRERAQRLRGR